MPDFTAAFSQVEQMATGRMRETNTPGLILAITDRECTLHTASFGYADLAARQPVTPEMLFEIGSIGKSFTALALMQLVEAGQIDVHLPVSQYLPWFSVRSEFDPITVHHLLSHTAGITNGADFTPSARYEPYALRFLDAAYPPGEHFHYSNVGYKTLGYLLEAVTGQPYRAIVQTRILDPLGMRATDATTTHASRPRMVTGYVPLFDDQPFHRDLPLIPAPWLEYSCADGSPAAPVEDMAIYLRMLLNRGAGIVSAASFARMIERVALMGPERFYGYGLISEDVDGRSVIGHGGGTVGYRTVLLGDLDEGIGVMIVANWRCALYDIARFALSQMHAALHDLPLPELPDPEDPLRVPQAQDYAGLYGDRIRLVAKDERLFLEFDGNRIPLEQREPDAFYVPHPDFRRYLLRFEREGERIVAATHGSTWHRAADASVSAAPEPPAAWLAYTGHYRSHNPWFSNFSVVLRRGQLILIRPEGFEEPLHPLDGEWFRAGDTPEQLRFDAIVDGQALRARFSGGDYYRQNV